MNILVTGGAGYVGSILIPDLIKEKHHVKCLDKFFFGKESLNGISSNQLELIEDEVNGINIEIERFSDGQVEVVRLDTNEEIVKERDFWFAWYAFHPDTGLYE